MSYYEKLGWKMGKENETFLKKGSEKLFFEILEKFNPKYVEAFKELLKYINKNSIISFIPHFFSGEQNKENKTCDDIIEAIENHKRVNLMEIIEFSPYDKERLLKFDEAIVENRICLKSNNLKKTYINMRKNSDNGNNELEIITTENDCIGYEAKPYNHFSMIETTRTKTRETIRINSDDVFETVKFKNDYNSEKVPFSFANTDAIPNFIVIEIAKEENYFFKDFSKEMKQILNGGIDLETFFTYFELEYEIKEMKEISSMKEYFTKFEMLVIWNKYHNKIPFVLNSLLFRSSYLINENVLRETVEKKDEIIQKVILNDKYSKSGLIQYYFSLEVCFLLRRIKPSPEKLSEIIQLINDTCAMSFELEIWLDLTKINSEKNLRKKHDKFSEEIKLRARLREKEKLETVFEFPKKFNPVIENLDAKYELIRNGKRLLEEGEEQHNCVFSYFKNITEGKCLIYSLLTETEENSEDVSGNSGKESKRYTIEIIERNGKFEVVQFLGKFNKKDAETVKLEAELREKLKKMKTISIPEITL